MVRGTKLPIFEDLFFLILSKLKYLALILYKMKISFKKHFSKIYFRSKMKNLINLPKIGNLRNVTKEAPPCLILRNCSKKLNKNSTYTDTQLYKNQTSFRIN